MPKLIPLAVVFLLLFSSAVVMRAEENAVQSTEAKHSESEIANLIKQLDSESFVLREAAVTDLTNSGLAAVPQVMEAAQGKSLEASARAFDVLNKWITGEDQLLKIAAQGALKKLAHGEEGDKAVRRAKALLAKSESGKGSFVSQVRARQQIIRPGAPVFPAARLGAHVQLRAMAKLAAGQRGRSVRISIAEGKKTIRVTEGDKLQVSIVEDEAKGIQIKVTEKDKDGKEKTTKYAAKNLKELKEKQPEGHKAYEKYAGALKGLKIRMQAAKAIEEAAVEAAQAE